MKKTIMIIVSAASLFAAVVLFVCDNPSEFENPLDKDGTNYLYGDTTNEKDKLGAGANNEPNLFDTVKYKQCDAVIPTIAIVGNLQKREIDNTPAGLQEYRRLMHFTGEWPALITWTKGDKGSTEPVPKDPCLKTGATGDCKSAFTEAEKQTVPAPGSYIIQYKVEKPKCNGVVPQAVKELVLICTTYVAPDTATPVITVLGDNPAEFRVGGAYTDRGVTISNGGELDSIVVKGTNSGNNYEQKLKTKPVVATAIVTPTNAAAGFTYTITYYASNAKGKVAEKKVRNLKVLDAPTSNVPAVIVLANYKHKLKNGTTAEYPDTMMYFSDIKSDDDYIEKGVDKVYYMKEGKEETVPKDLVKITKPTIKSQTAPTTRTGNYVLDPGNGYAGTSVKRSVFLVDKNCENPGVEPEVTKLLSDTIPAGVAWEYINSWSVVNKDEEWGDKSAGYKYFIHFAGLNPNSPKAGTYKITYVGLGKCGKTRELERTITVK